MSVRTRLTLLLTIFGLALAISIGALLLLSRTASNNLNIANNALQQQSAALKMQAQLRDAEAALYRYEIEGETGFALRFREQMQDFIEELETYERLASTQQSQTWVADLRRAHQEAITLGEDLIGQRELQNTDLQTISSISKRSTSLLTQSMLTSRPDDLAYQRLINGKQTAINEMQLALTGYLATPQEIRRIEFIDSIATFRTYHDQLLRLTLSPEEQQWASNVAVGVNDIETIGAQLISLRTQRKADYANFALVLFRAGQGTIVDEIQPQVAATIEEAQVLLDRSVRNSLLISIGTALIAALVLTAVTLPLLQQLNRNIGALLDGAESVAAGHLDTHVTVNDQHEFSRLATAFNKMTQGLSIRERRLQELIQKLSLVQEEERRLVGLDLHDGLTQMLLSANMHFNAFESKFRTIDVNGNKKQFDRGKMRLKEAIDEARWVVSELRPTELEDFGLVDGLRRYTAKVAIAQQWKDEFEANLDDYGLSSATETAIFRIMQEAISNARKHAETKRLRVSLLSDHTDLHLRVRDWGVGFNANELDTDPDRFGMIGMEERAALIGGKLNVSSQPGYGTEVHLEIPRVLASKIEPNR